MAMCFSEPTYRSAYTPHPMSKEELSSSVSVQLFNGETQQLTITLENIGSEDIETLELTSKIVSTKGKHPQQDEPSLFIIPFLFNFLALDLDLQQKL